MPGISLTVLPGTYSIHQLESLKQLPDIPEEVDFYTFCRTADEISLVCPAELTVNAVKTESDWKCLKIVGPLDFSLTGILAGISSCLAEEKISIFAVSTFDTDYILIRTPTLQNTLKTLESNQYIII